MRACDLFEGPLAARLALELPGYRPRSGQIAMAGAVERAIEAERPLFVEAGTGIGKTLAYLVPAILSEKKVVISTATRALQDQLVAKDIPLVARALAGRARVSVALVKGLTNYLCRRRLAEARTKGGTFGGGGIDLARIEEWAKVTETGDRVELPSLRDDAPAWDDVRSSTDTRIGASCSYFESCFVTRMRRGAEDARIVVVNHHLFCADLALRRGGAPNGVLPPYDVVIFDEAHQLEDIATDFFGTRLSSVQVELLARDAARVLFVGDAAQNGKGRRDPGPLLRPRSPADLVLQHGAALFAALQNPGPERRGDARRPLGAAERELLGGALATAFDESLTVLEGAADPLPGEAPAQIARRARAIRADLALLAAPPNGSSVAWVHERERSVSLGLSPIDVGASLREDLFGRTGAVIFTSATLAAPSTGGGLAFSKARLGAPPNAEELITPSPFDYPNRAGLYVARDLPEPADPRFDDAAATCISELAAVTRGGAFVLCTSTRAMGAIHRRLVALKLPFPLLLQGTAPKASLLASFRSAENAVLVATMGFWEGVDVPGRALRLVVMDKLPFSVPSDPVVAARTQAIEAEGRSSFYELSVPTAALTLKQGFGRLLRTESDAGIVALLDRRAVTKGYGTRLLAALPPARRLKTLGEVRSFWAAIEGEPRPATGDQLPFDQEIEIPF